MEKRNKLLPSFSLAQRKEAKETSTPSKPSPIWEGLTAPTRRSFIKVSSPHQRGGLSFFSAYARSLAPIMPIKPILPIKPIKPIFVIPMLRYYDATLLRFNDITSQQKRAAAAALFSLFPRIISHSTLHTPRVSTSFLLPPSSFVLPRNYSSSLPLILNAIASVGVELAEIRPFIIRCLGGGNG